jgi:predicted GIY-YIG superfamily endonuclease
MRRGRTRAKSSVTVARGKRAAAAAPRLSHNVYVIELAPAVLREARFRRRNPQYIDGQPCVYVGMTGLSVAERYANHKRGHKGNVFAGKYGKRLLPELFAHLNPMPYEAALTMERELAEDLRQAGYGVWQG